MAPQTPPPGASDSFAALTIASTSSVVMSAIAADIALVDPASAAFPPKPGGLQ